MLKGDLYTLTELTSTGKSGSFFYYTENGRFLLKTVSVTEFHFLKSILKLYYHHIINNKDTFIVK
jgi:1-phosphatidylinositol-4-phosphate 5-kinase